MRRYSLLLAAAAVLLAVLVGVTYQARLGLGRQHPASTPQIEPSTATVANHGWEYKKDDPLTNKPVVIVRAQSLEASQAPATFKLRGLELRLFHKNGASYTYVQSESGLFDERSGSLKSEGPITIIMNVPNDKDASKPEQVATLVRVATSGVTYDTKTQKADTDQAATFQFPKGGGSGMGVSYDPNTGNLHVKSNVSLDWVGRGPATNKMHIEAGDLVYNEREQKIDLTPWSKLVRQTTTVQAQSSVVLLQDDELHQVDSEHAAGSDVREDKHTEYSADHLTAHFDEDGVMTEMDGIGNAHVSSAGLTSRTTMTGDQARLLFQVVQQPGASASESDLHQVFTDGHAVAQSEPLAKPGVALSDTRIMRSDHIYLTMKPGGQDVQEIRTSTEGQLEFKPNQPGAPHRLVDAAQLQVLYGEGNYIDRFVAANAKTQTDRPVPKKPENPSGISTAYTWSDHLAAVFVPQSNNVQTIEQKGHFRYEEGVRKASASTALLEQASNRITLTGAPSAVDGTRVADDKGSTMADRIVMNQTSGDMDAFGHVMSSHAPDKNAKPGTSMLDATQTMQAKADQMETRESNAHIYYQGHVVMWQGANRLTGDRIEIDRDNGNLQAEGKVFSELVDTRNDNADASGAPSSPVFTVVRAPKLVYTDGDRLAYYTGGVTLVHDKMTVDSKELKAFLSPKSEDHKDDSSLDHAFAEGNVKVSQEISPGVTRVGTSEHAEYYTKLSKVVLNGGAPQLEDTRKGLTKGRQLTYFSDDDRLIVEGEKAQMAYTKMKKK